MSENPKKYLLVVILALLLLIVAALVASTYDPFLQSLKYLRRGNIAETPHAQDAQKTGEPNQLKIASLEITAPILYAQTNSETEFQDLLKDGVVHFPGTAEIGQPGNAYIFGHSSDFITSKGHYKTVFALLPRIQVGAEIEISDKQGVIYYYKVVSTKIVAANDVSVLDQGDGSKKILTLQTSYPVGTALKRFVAIAELE